MPIRKLWYFTAAMLTWGLYAESTTVLDNATVRVISAVDHPHQKGALHKHDSNRVMIYLQAGRQNFEYPDEKKKMVVTWKPGEAKWSPAGGMHIAEIVSNDPVSIIDAGDNGILCSRLAIP